VSRLHFPCTTVTGGLPARPASEHFELAVDSRYARLVTGQTVQAAGPVSPGNGVQVVPKMTNMGPGHGLVRLWVKRRSSRLIASWSPGVRAEWRPV
jgi:hypothetical protein